MKILILLSVVFVCSIANAADYRAQLNGKTLTMSGASCAGISLKKNAGLFNEMGNNPPCEISLKTRLKWIDGTTFALIEKERINDISPPRVFLYKVKSVKGTQVVLTNIWTGWNDFKDEDITYSIK